MVKTKEKRLKDLAQKALDSYFNSEGKDVSAAYDILRYAKKGLYRTKKT